MLFFCINKFKNVFFFKASWLTAVFPFWDCKEKNCVFFFYVLQEDVWWTCDKLISKPKRGFLQQHDAYNIYWGGCKRQRHAFRRSILTKILLHVTLNNCIFETVLIINHEVHSEKDWDGKCVRFYSDIFSLETGILWSNDYWQILFKFKSNSWGW